uniref:Uncharacterized protein n=1 Tax=viral metagenome TaxID=1070528 RepID=A0A6C0JBV6_9ZZZZ
MNYKESLLLLDDTIAREQSLRKYTLGNQLSKDECYRKLSLIAKKIDLLKQLEYIHKNDTLLENICVIGSVDVKHDNYVDTGVSFEPFTSRFEDHSSLNKNLYLSWIKDKLFIDKNFNIGEFLCMEKYKFMSLKPKVVDYKKKMVTTEYTKSHGFNTCPMNETMFDAYKLQHDTEIDILENIETIMYKINKEYSEELDEQRSMFGTLMLKFLRSVFYSLKWVKDMIKKNKKILAKFLHWNIPREELREYYEECIENDNKPIEYEVFETLTEHYKTVIKESVYTSTEDIEKFKDEIVAHLHDNPIEDDMKRRQYLITEFDKWVKYRDLLYCIDTLEQLVKKFDIDLEKLDMYGKKAKYCFTSDEEDGYIYITLR